MKKLNNILLFLLFAIKICFANTITEPIKTEDGGQFCFGDGLTWYEWGSVLCDAGTSIYEKGNIPEAFWNQDGAKYQDYPLHMPGTVAGVSDGAIEEILGIPLLVKFGLEICTDKAKAQAMWESVKNVNIETIKQLVTDKIENYNFSDKPYIGYHELGKDGVTVASIFFGGFLTKGKNVAEVVEESGTTIKKAIQEKLNDLDGFMSTPEFGKLMNDAFTRYKGQLSRADWVVKYKTLYKNREIGKLTEVKFKELMGGESKTFTLPNNEIRKVDNLIGTTAKEIKSGQLRKTDFIETQLKKDIEMLSNQNIPVKKIEWHLFDGADDNMLEVLKSLRDTYGKDKFDFIDYNNLQ